jgi:Holliday junction resolvase RusA-like endonuclease
MLIILEVQGIPKGQPRPRAFARAGRARVYDPGTAEAWKGAIALAARPQLPAQPIEGPVQLVIRHTMPRPKGHFGSGKNALTLKPGAPELHTGKPDIDNLVKAALDALTHIGMWRDDDQVFDIRATKRYGERPGARIIIQTP